MILALSGFMGCGKSSVGRVLSARLGCPFTDLDDHIEACSGKAIPEIFAHGGQAEFRRMEVDALHEILSSDWNDGLVLSLGGGTLTSPEASELIAGNTLCVYLRASEDTLVANLLGATSSRPLLSDAGDGEDALRARIHSLMDARRSIYESAAGIIVDTDGKSDEAIASEIISRTE